MPFAVIHIGLYAGEMKLKMISPREQISFTEICKAHRFILLIPIEVNSFDH
jgi:hypothetical protein